MFENIPEIIISLFSLRGLSFLIAGLGVVLYLELIARLFPSGCIGNDTEAVAIYIFLVIGVGVGVLVGIPEAIVFCLSGIIGALVSYRFIEKLPLSHRRVELIAKAIVYVIGGLAGVIGFVQLWFACKSSGLWGVVAFAAIVAEICLFIIVRIVKACREAAFYKRVYEDDMKHAYVYIYNANAHTVALETNGYGQTIHAGGYSKRILKGDAEAEMNFLRSLSIPETDIKFKPMLSSDNWVYPPHQNLDATEVNEHDI